MQRLVSPDLNVHTISDLEALSELVAGLRLNSTLASNLREVLGLQTVGNGSPRPWLVSFPFILLLVVSISM